MPSGAFWTEQEDILIRQHYPTATWEDWKSILPHRSADAIRFHASKLGIRKDKRAYEWKDDFNGNGKLLDGLCEAAKGYIAGIIDADGSIGFYKSKAKQGRKPTYRFTVTVVNTRRELIDWFSKMLPGNAYVREQSISKSSQWRKRPIYSWMLTGSRRVQQFCKEIAPYLVLKRKQAEILSNGYIHLSPEERDKLVERMKELNSQ